MDEKKSLSPRHMVPVTGAVERNRLSYLKSFGNVQNAYMSAIMDKKHS